MRSVRLDLHLRPNPRAGRSRKRFRPGERVQGWLDVECHEPTACRALTVGLQPWIVGASSVQGYEQLPPVCVLFRGELAAGRHRFPFSFSMPAGPLSHAGEFSSLSWRLGAELDRGAMLHDLLLPASAAEPVELVSWEARDLAAPRAPQRKIPDRFDRLERAWHSPGLEKDEEASPTSLLWSAFLRATRRVAPVMLAPEALVLGEAFDVYCLWPRRWKEPGRIDVEVGAMESNLVRPPGDTTTPRYAYPFGVAADLEAISLADVGSILDTGRKQFASAYRARLQLPFEALPTHPLIRWNIRLRARPGGSSRRSVVGQERVWESWRSVSVLPWWGTSVGSSSPSGTLSSPALGGSAEVSAAA